ncbi:MAG: hypothetical protein LBD59_01550 [Prevotellaceae bacterium]|jgi:hypothetical protein|nr:hypothetical protein [Prevotellaceae bacterium]
MTLLGFGFLEFFVVVSAIAGLILVFREKSITQWVTLYWVTAILLLNFIAVGTFLLWKYIYVPLHRAEN